MKHPLRGLFVFYIWATALCACAEPSAPLPALPPPSDAPLMAVNVSGPSEIPTEPGFELPPEFSTAPLISSAAIDAGFKPGHAFSVASMVYWSSHSRITLKLRLKRADILVDSVSDVLINEELLPRSSALSLPLTLSTPRNCGHRTDSNASFSAWMGFPMPKTGTLFTWGLVTIPASKPAAQAVCKDPEPEVVDDLDDGDGEEYSGECEVCQEWFTVVNGRLVSNWWECSDVSDSLCSSAGSRG